MNASTIQTRIIAIDDDPTGSQTVHSCLLLTAWDVDTLVTALQDVSPLFFILSNTRGMDAARAADVTRSICINLKQALEKLKQDGVVINPIVVSRSDSTLRGHYPVETDIIAQELGPFDAHFMVPAFFEAGRFTRDSVHYLMVNGKPVPVNETEFAKDSVFGFSTAYLPDYVEEKTRGRIKAGAVERFLLSDVRGDCRDRLRGLSGNVCCVVDSEYQADLNHFADQLQAVAREGKRFLFRSAASLLTALAKLPPQPVKPEDMAYYVRDRKPGVILIGSHVAKTSAQLAYLREHTDVVPIHIEVERLKVSDSAQRMQTTAGLADEILAQVDSAHARGKTVALYTSRTELQFPSQAQRLAFGEQVSAFLMDLVQRLPRTIGFLISKGGITSNDVLSTGLKLKQSRVVGQILTGCSVIRCPADHSRYPELPVVIFPGNVGDDTALAQAYTRLTTRHTSDTVRHTA
ncbi:MAG: four-carbon acid sugar kinase family protein [Gammaproteobacteria bacterium]|nr:four-carbon acid sugar kinase family protein [Gammaproteobacteria bacterium]